MPELKLLIENEGKAYLPVVKDEITWETSRQGSPGKLTFSVLKDGVLNFQEGNKVVLSVDGRDTFCGYVFVKSRNKDGLIQVTAYDQLRYLKNKNTIQYENKKASEVIRMIAEDFQLECGEIEDTGYVIPSRLEDNQTLFDMIKNALDETLQATKEMYILYDDFGSLTLKNIASMKRDALIHKDVAENFDYSSSIDSNTYNRIWLAYDNQKTGKREIYEVSDSASMERWGVLQYFEKLNNPENGKKKADALIQYYNRKTRSLSIQKAFGDIRVRGGTMAPVTLNLGDIIANTYMIVEKVTHKLSGDTHFMDLTLIGGDFVA